MFKERVSFLAKTSPSKTRSFHQAPSASSVAVFVKALRTSGSEKKHGLLVFFIQRKKDVFLDSVRESNIQMQSFYLHHTSLFALVPSGEQRPPIPFIVMHMTCCLSHLCGHRRWLAEPTPVLEVVGFLFFYTGFDFSLPSPSLAQTVSREKNNIFGQASGTVKKTPAPGQKIADLQVKKKGTTTA